jgi:Poxvirus D5 protein-like
MRSILGIFGMVAGLIVVALVARYGFVTSDTPVDGAIVAFFFAVIALGGIGGPAVAVHLWRSQRGAGKVWGLIVGLVAGVALLANLSNSLGAIATRADKTLAERNQITTARRDDRAELQRLIRERAALPTFTPTTAEAVQAAQRAADEATRARRAECGDGDPAERGTNCRAYEAAERQALAGLTVATTNKATAEAAGGLEDRVAAVRARLAVSEPVASTNPLADALGRIFALSAEHAATWQQVATVVVVELLIAVSLVALELLRPERAAPPVPIQTGPRLVADRGKVVGSVNDFVVECVEAAKGAKVTFEEMYRAYAAWCQAVGFEPLGPQQFVEPLEKLCVAADVPTRTAGSKVYLVNVRLVPMAA